MVQRLFVITALSAAVALAACSSVPVHNAALEDARSQLRTAQSDPKVQQHAREELTRAVAALQRAEAARTADQPREEIDHLAYMASRRVVLARETGAARHAQAVVEGAQAERDALLLKLRTAEADEAQRQLTRAEQRVDSQGQALAQAERSAATDRERLAQAGRDTATERGERARSDARAAELAQELARINATRTERGIVVTLGDMLFHTGQAQVQAAGRTSLTGLADFMRRNPERSATIEGHTDSVGSADANQALSERRAEAVRDMLVSMGVERSRLQTAGHGQRHPVADNGSANGRQRNRRVEIVFTPQAGDVLAR